MEIEDDFLSLILRSRDIVERRNAFDECERAKFWSTAEWRDKFIDLTRPAVLNRAAVRHMENWERAALRRRAERERAAERKRAAELERVKSKLLEGMALLCEESRKVWDKLTMDKVQASRLLSTYADVILAFSSDKRKAFYERVHEEKKQLFEERPSPYGEAEVMLCLKEAEAEILKREQLHKELVGRFIVKLKVLLRSGTTKAEEDASPKPEVVERMYDAQVEEMLSKAAVEEEVTTQLEGQAELLYAVVVSAVSLLLFVYQYLIGHIDKGGTLTCSSGSFQFRFTYISIVLFEGAYVWIKFRDVASTGRGGYRRPVKDKLSGTIKLSKPEARYTPPGQSGNHIYLGVCADDQEVKIKKQIAAFYYGRDVRHLELGNGLYFQMPLMPREQEQGFSVPEKRKWVKDKVREVYEDFQKDRAIPSSVGHNLDRQINPSLSETNGIVVGFPIPSEDPPLAFDTDFQIENVEDFSREIFPLLELCDAQLQHPFEDIQPHGPEIGVLTSGGYHFNYPELAGTDCLIASGDILNTLPECTPVVAAISNQVDAWIVDGNAQHDSEASQFPSVSSILSPQERSDAEAVLMVRIREVEQMVNDRDQMIREADHREQAMKQMIDARDRKVSELELENLRLRAMISDHGLRAS